MRANSRKEFLTAAARVRRLLESPEIRSTRELNLDQMLVEGYNSRQGSRCGRTCLGWKPCACWPSSTSPIPLKAHIFEENHLRHALPAA